jgi:hypothetical protein
LTNFGAPFACAGIHVAKILTGEIEVDTGDFGQDKAAHAEGRRRMESNRSGMSDRS